ncbi:tetratricopeptide repeat protein [Thiocystis violacea]|uniref:tetratricopeptide repeat protein n=1 Tax=Thiocystis violacea TaxID=13725 RepID=UPI0019070EFB|nr:tetratricopeptide repeat protein [Thiocystis violacea]
MFCLFSTMAQAGRVESVSELLRLPAYCRGTQQIRDISQDPTPIDVYIKKYGWAYSHLHHYCWALNEENRISIARPPDGKFWLGEAIKDIDYVLNQNRNPKFIFLPEMYTTKARILFKLDKPLDAVLWLKKAIEANPRYVPAYSRLSDYYLDQGNTAEAIKILEQGISRSQQSAILQRKLRELRTDSPSTDKPDRGSP